MLRTVLCLLGGCLALAGCGSEARSSASSRPRSEATATDRGETEAPEVEPTAPAREAPLAAPTEPDFDAPLPDVACPDEVRVRLAHRSESELPPILDRAVAFRSEDGRRVRIAIANHPLELDRRGRFALPAIGEARFELDAVRRRRRPLEPRVLGPPDSRRGGLSHVRIVTPGPLLTFGHRDIGTVELTEVGPERVCGRIDLDDGFSRVRGAFTAPVAGPLPP